MASPPILLTSARMCAPCRQLDPYMWVVEMCFTFALCYVTLHVAVRALDAPLTSPSKQLLILSKLRLIALPGWSRICDRWPRARRATIISVWRWCVRRPVGLGPTLP